jgi:hypothetical protein
MKNTEFKWPSGTEYCGDEWRPEAQKRWFKNADVWGFTMILVATVGSLGVVLLAVVGVLK